MTAYRYLSDGEEAKSDDQFKRDDGVWVILSDVDIKKWKKATGKPLIREKGDKPVRRKIEDMNVIKDNFT